MGAWVHRGAFRFQARPVVFGMGQIHIQKVSGFQRPIQHVVQTGRSRSAASGQSTDRPFTV